MLFPLPRWATAAAVLSTCLLSASPLYAWGPEGHSIVAAIAAEHLRPQALEEMHRLLGTVRLSAAANWPDRIEAALPATGAWHYVNIPSSAAGYLARRDCPRQDCVVAKIEWFSGILRDRRQSPAARLVAMEYLIHLVGDIHQPFHALADARGGNDIPVIFFGSNRCGAGACELHYVWDTGLIRHTGLDRRQYVAFLERMIEHDGLDAAPDDPVTWANQSFQLAKKALAPPGAEIDQRYYDRERPIMDRQLALAGLRLASLLNQDLDPGGSSPAPRRSR